MLFFDYLKHLDTHLGFLQKKIKDKHTLFLVGGCVRDPLLGLDKNPTDIDFTMAGEPKKIDKLIDKTGMSYFMTEKFGTMTLIKDTMKYELTPLRTESNYTDSRHPDVINRSNDVLLDSNRRDFTINCIYYTNTPYKTEYTSLIDKKNIHKYSDDETFLKRLDDHGYLYINNQKLLIIQDHKIIAKLFAEGKLQADQIKSILKAATVFTIGKKAEVSKQLKIIIDPHKGIHDSINKKLRAVGDPDHRFTEDALRIIRAIRFVNVLNAKLLLPKKGKVKLFDFEKTTRNSIKKNHGLIKNVAKERIKEEVMKVFLNYKK
ncbi:MAG: hypothetical protein NT085_03410 [candidate division SR1 bacterium]|nr:hypothetical protein [candidate division SR1 bacterium]